LALNLLGFFPCVCVLCIIQAKLLKKKRSSVVGPKVGLKSYNTRSSRGSMTVGCSCK
jgi:hypothetical protein